MSNEPNATMVDRIQQRLKRLGVNDGVLPSIDDGQVTLFCTVANRDDHSMIQVAVPLIPKVKSVVLTAESQQEDKS